MNTHKNLYITIAVLVLALVGVSAGMAYTGDPEGSAGPEALAETAAPAPEPDAGAETEEDDIPELHRDIVIYGGGLQAVAAAAKAGANAPDAMVAVVVPYPVDELGGIATTGGQNYWDVREADGTLFQGGSFAWWYKAYPSGYSTDDFADFLHHSLMAYENIDIRYLADIRDVEGENGEISRVLTGAIHRDGDGVVQWGDGAGEENLLWLSGDVFIDASEDGRLTRLAGLALETEDLLTTGRYDWPAEYLDDVEQNADGVGRQQAATLMFKVTGVQPGKYDDMTFQDDTAWGGNEAMETDPVVIAFNERFRSQGYLLKGVNMARDGESSDEWWVNVLLVFDVDGRAHERDRGTALYPDDMLPGMKNTDEAWRDARAFLETYADELTEALSRYDGMAEVELVRDDAGEVVTGDILYIRETVHLVEDAAAIANGAEDNYAVTAHHTLFAGDGSGLGADAASAAFRVGLGYYQADIHPYSSDDLTDGHGSYVQVSEYARQVRRDLTLGEEVTENPVYISYYAMVTDQVENLLVAGYASGISAVAWSELRVFPNICVLGDAAGVAAAYCLDRGEMPSDLGEGDMEVIRDVLRGRGAILDKQAGA